MDDSKTAASIVPVDKLAGLKRFPNAKVKSLELGSVFLIWDKIQELGLSLPPALLDREFLERIVTGDDRADKIVTLNADSIEKRTQVFFKWALAQKELAPLIIGSLSDLAADQIAQLPLIDAFKVVIEGIRLIDVPLAVELVTGFFTEFGDLMVSVRETQAKLGGTPPAPVDSTIGATNSAAA